jgi:hypothetical protein
MPTIVRPLVRGLVAGAVGTAAAMISTALERRLRRIGAAPSEVETRSSGKESERTPPSHEEPRASLSGYGYGIAWGIPRALLHAAGAGRRSAVLLHLVTLWGTSLAILPGLRVIPPPAEPDAASLGLDAFHHLVYAVAADAAYEALGSPARGPCGTTAP